MNDERKPDIDERLQALRESVELLTHDIHEMQREMKAADSRERKARQAILAGIAGYLRALDDGQETQ